MKNLIYSTSFLTVFAIIVFNEMFLLSSFMPDKAFISLEDRDSVPPGLVGPDPHTITIVNMIPNSLSSEDKNDGEPNIAVDPLNPNIIAGSAFSWSQRRELCSPIPCVPGDYPTCKAPIYYSNDGGMSWNMAEVIVSNNGTTHDITLAFGPSGYLYASFLKGCHDPDNSLKGLITMRSTLPLTTPIPYTSLSMEVMDDRTWNTSNATRRSNIFDQPWITATTNGTNDQVYIATNKSSDRLPGGSGKTARILISGNGRLNSFTGYQIETIQNIERNLCVRVAGHRDGKVYAMFYRWISGGMVSDMTHPHPFCEVVVVRDDHYGIGNFDDLRDGGPSSDIGKRVASGTIPTSRAMATDLSLRLPPGSQLGQARLLGLNLSMVVDPNNDDHVVIAWCALDGDTYTLFTNESYDGGETWTELFPGIPNTMNPALAITDDGRVGLLYQQLVDHAHAEWWETHFVMGAVTGHRLHSRDYMLHRFPDAELPVLDAITVGKQPALGDYLDLEAVGNTFYGIFSAMNSPDRDRFHGGPRVIYQRGEDGRSLLGVDGATVAPSVDPFFFKVSTRTPAVP